MYLVLPDGMVSNQKCQYGFILKCLAMKEVGKFYGHSAYFTAIWYILWTFWYTFPRFGMLHQETFGNLGHT
jgi:hypothetical protein